LTEYIQPTLSNFRCEKDWYSVREIAEIYKVSTSTIRSWIIKGYLKGEMVAPVSAKAKTMRGHYRVYPSGLLDDIELHRAELIEISMKSWPVLLAKLNKQKT
jgi:DNA-binding transcriptional MerR regulator